MAFPPPQIIETDRTILRAPAASDLPALLSVNGDDEVARFLPYDAWRNLGDGEQWLMKTDERRASGEAQQYVVVLRANGEVIGACILFGHKENDGCAEIGYVLGREHWGKGIMREALTGMIDRCFSDLGLRRLEAEANPENVRSTKILGRLGFAPEGLLRQRRKTTEGAFADSAIYGLLREHWRGLRKAAPGRQSGPPD